MGVSDILEIGKQGLAANRQALQTTSNNIANANTPGYSRQRPVFESSGQFQSDGQFFGGGVNIPRVIRVHDEFVNRQLVDESRLLGGARVRTEGMKHIESVLNRDGFEVSEVVNGFFNSVRELTANPESQTSRSLVLESAKTAANGFRRANESLDDMRRDLDLRLGAMCESVNASTKELAGLNGRIAHFQSLGQEPNELLDRRDAIIRDLSLKLGYPTTTDERGQLNYSASGVGSLVVGNEANELVLVRTPEDGKKGDGSVDVFVKDAFGLHKVTQGFKDGEFGGLLEIRDTVITDLKDKLDSSAYMFSTSVNQVHAQGVGLDGRSDRNLFLDVGEVKGAASRMGITAEALASPDIIASGYTSNAPGDNRAALALADLQNAVIMPLDGIIREDMEHHQTLNEALNSIVGTIATRASKEDQLLRHQESIVGQLENYRQSISGVSLEEEAINMMQYQAVFNASAKTMKMGDELLQTILSLKD